MTHALTRRLIQACVVASLLAALAPPAVAQELQIDPKPSRRVRLDGVCADSLKRFCPALADRPGQSLSQVICLKPYRTSLPLACRRAVTAALK